MLTAPQLADLRRRCDRIARQPSKTRRTFTTLRGGPLDGFPAEMKGEVETWALATQTDTGCVLAEYDGAGQWRGWRRADEQGC